MGIGGTVDHFRTVHGEGAGIFGIGPLVGHHNAQAPDFGINDRPEGVKVAAISLEPPIEDVVRADRVLNGEERRNLVVLQDHLAFWIENKPNVEEPIFDLRVTSFGLGYDKGIVLSGDFSEFFGLLARDVDGTFSCKLHMIEIKHFIIEGLKCSFREGNQPDRKVQT